MCVVYVFSVSDMHVVCMCVCGMYMLCTCVSSRQCMFGVSVQYVHAMHMCVSCVHVNMHGRPGSPVCPHRLDVSSQF